MIHIRNCITHAEGSNAVSSSKCPDMLARYCDSILRKSAKNSEDTEMEEQLNQVVSHLIPPIGLL